MIASAPERVRYKKKETNLSRQQADTGIALAMIAQLLNIEIELVLPEDSTKERYANHASIRG
jgi:cysteine synthase B